MKKVVLAPVGICRGFSDPAEVNRVHIERNLDKLFKRYIRMRDKKCIISGASRRLTLVYYYGEKFAPMMRWDEMNAHMMSSTVSEMHVTGDPEMYRDWMYEHYTKEEMIELRRKALHGRKYFPLDVLLAMSVDYTRKLKELEEMK